MVTYDPPPKKNHIYLSANEPLVTIMWTKEGRVDHLPLYEELDDFIIVGVSSEHDGSYVWGEF